MRPGRPKQHIHNWSWALTEWSKFQALPEKYKGMDSPGGFSSRRYWKCVRGGKIKHTYREPEYKDSGRVFIMASGIGYLQHQRID